MNDRRRDSNIVGLSIEESEIARQIEQAKKRAAVCCPEYDQGNIFWKGFDVMLEVQSDIIQRIKLFDTDVPNAPLLVTPLINKPSPTKTVPNNTPQASPNIGID